MGGYTQNPLRIGDAEPVYKFKGYRRDLISTTLMYTVNDLPVKHTVSGVPGQLGVEHSFVFEKAPNAPVSFAVKTDDVSVTAEQVGTFADGKLTFSTGMKAFKFKVVARK